MPEVSAEAPASCDKSVWANEVLLGSITEAMHEVGGVSRGGGVGVSGQRRLDVGVDVHAVWVTRGVKRSASDE